MANNRFANAVENQFSRYVQGGETDRFNNRLGWWERRDLPKQDNDYRTTVQVGESGRPDMISFRVYGNARYAWLVLQYNTIVDPVTELTPGTEILLPEESRLLLDIISKTTGGNVIL